MLDKSFLIRLGMLYVEGIHKAFSLVLQRDWKFKNT